MTDSKKKFTVLAVDDTPENLDVVKGILTPEYIVKVAINGPMALKIAEKQAPDLILLDIMMPGMNGYEVCRKLKSSAQTSDIPVIFLTAMDQVENKTVGFEAGGTDYVTKPFEMIEVKTRVCSLLKAKIYNDYMAEYQQTLETEVAKRTAQLRVAKDQISKSFIETLFRLAISAEFKDTDTGAHILRIGQYAALIAKKMGRDDEFCQSLSYAAPLHDIGKIGIPDSVLLKPGKLDAEEWAIMQQHTLHGGAILEHSRSNILNLGRLIALSHHEKWDGSGYPNGTREIMIPLEGRIVALVDVYDTLISKRCYKDPMPIEKALSIIKEGREAHFDPQVVDVFLENLDEINAIRDTFQDGNGSLLTKHFTDIFRVSPEESVLLPQQA